MKPDDKTNSSVVKQLREEKQELRSRLREDSGKNPVASLRIEPRDLQVKTRAETQKESELQLQKKRFRSYKSRCQL